MNLEFATNYFDQFINLEHKENPRAIKLETMKLLCDHFDHPELSCPCIHVAGSKGKGSITTMLGNILKSAGFKKVGLYRSPALVYFTDRISEVDGPFPETVYRQAFDELKTGIEKLRATQKNLPLTWFELVTLYAFLTFRTAGCDYAVYEVGMGGRLDATNVVKPTVSVISNIELEHTEVLGDTLEKVATEKAGIIKPDTPSVISPQIPEDLKTIFCTKAKAVGASEPIFPPDKLTTAYFLDDQNHLRMHVEELGADLRLVGDHQAANALVAQTAASLVLQKSPSQIPSQPRFADSTQVHAQSPAIKSGLEAALLPGRFELKTSAELIDFPKIPYLLLDGAHTEKSIAGVIQTLEIYRRLLAKEKTYDSCLTDFALDQPPVLLFACAKNKPVEAMANILAPYFSKAILTKPGDFKTPDLPRAEEAFKNTTLETVLVEDHHVAIKTAFEEANETSRALIVLGSFYLVAEVKKYLAETLAEKFEGSVRRTEPENPASPIAETQPPSFEV